MEGRETPAGRLRVVVLSRDSALASRLADLCAPPVAVVRVASGYEAGAEILAAPVAAMVIDFRSMDPAHARLLDMARETGVEMLGVGATPRGLRIDQLSGLRLVSRTELPAAVGRIAQAARQAAPVDRAPEPPPEPQAPSPVQAAEPTPRPRRPARKTAKRRKTARKRPKPAPTAPAEKPFPAPAEPAPVEPLPTGSPSQLLTPEELAALLEDEP